MEHEYGSFDKKQFNEYKKKLHKKLFWLLIYKDPETKEEYPDVTSDVFEKYFTNIMYEISGLNRLLFYPVEICSMLSILEAALNETQKVDFDYKAYRKLILDAHALIDKIKEEGDRNEY